MAFSCALAQITIVRSVHLRLSIRGSGPTKRRELFLPPIPYVHTAYPQVPVSLETQKWLHFWSKKHLVHVSHHAPGLYYHLVDRKVLRPNIPLCLCPFASRKHHRASLVLYSITSRSLCLQLVHVLSLPRLCVLKTCFCMKLVLN